MNDLEQLTFSVEGSADAVDLPILINAMFGIALENISSDGDPEENPSIDALHFITIVGLTPEMKKTVIDWLSADKIYHRTIQVFPALAHH